MIVSTNCACLLLMLKEHVSAAQPSSWFRYRMLKRNHSFSVILMCTVNATLLPSFVIDLNSNHIPIIPITIRGKSVFDQTPKPMCAPPPPQGESTCRKRIRKLEANLAGLRDKLGESALSEEKAAEEAARAEARASSAEEAERKLHTAVAGIKIDFEVCFCIVVYLFLCLVGMRFFYFSMRRACTESG